MLKIGLKRPKITSKTAIFYRNIWNLVWNLLECFPKTIWNLLEFFSIGIFIKQQGVKMLPLSAQSEQMTKQQLLDENDKYNQQHQPEIVTGLVHGERREVEVRSNQPYCKPERDKLAGFMRVRCNDGFKLTQQVQFIAGQLLTKKHQALGSNHNTREKMEELVLAKEMLCYVCRVSRVNNPLGQES